VLSTPIHVIDDPIRDPRWADLLERHPSASIFHTPEWLDALRRTYGYEPFVVTSSSSGGPLDDGMVVCRVKGLAGRRLVSLPFSDHCEPLVAGADDGGALVAFLVSELQATGASSLEVRPRSPGGQPFQTAARACGMKPGGTYCLHSLDLEMGASEIFRRFHASSTQRAIHRAERENLTWESGRSDRLLAGFYRLLRMTRRRHGLPPQPIAWFRNLIACLGDAVTIHVAGKDGRPVASVFTLSFRQTMVYKYGGSDASRHALGGMPFLFWRLIQDACKRGFVELDLGRSDLDQSGLIAFKDHLGAARSTLSYCRYPEASRDVRVSDLVSRVARGIVPHLPNVALDLAGRLLYRHMG
jgi:CelD/BcsL family acetyltransferase involved in cellulose biosynthesis